MFGLLGDCEDLCLIDKKVWMTFARQPDHAVVEIFDPATKSFAITQFDHHCGLPLTQRSQVERFLPRVAKRRFVLPSCTIIVCHIAVYRAEYRLV